MRTIGYPHCCTTDVVYGLGATDNQDWDARSGQNMTLAQKYNYLRDRMTASSRRAMVTAVCTDQQQEFLKVARVLGWRFGPWAASKNHINTKTRLCYWLVQDGVPDDVTCRNKLGLTT